MLSFSRIDHSLFSKNWGLFMLWGIALIMLGVIAISADMLSTIVSVLFLGGILAATGMIIIFDTVTFWRNHNSGFLLHFLMGVIYLTAGFILLKNPIAGSISLTLLLGIVYLSLGVFRTVYSFSLRSPRWGWALLNGIISFILGILILASWPASSLYIIGLFVGIDLVFTGWMYFTAGLAARSLGK